jgi:hypothetical protein
MTDYYPLIARAIAGLDPSAPGESRRALYERARAALVAQLRSVQPPLSESEISRERLSLEEAVRKVESKGAQLARDAARAAAAAPADAFRRASARSGEPALSPSSSQHPSLEPSRWATRSTFRTRDELAADREAAQASRDKEAAQARAAEEQRRLDVATQEREEQEAARIREERRRGVRDQLAKVASPEPSIDQNGRLDAGPNAVYDEPKGGDNLATLPIRQGAVITTILSDLPGNSPKYLKTALEGYGDELKVRGAQPILGLLFSESSIRWLNLRRLFRQFHPPIRHQVGPKTILNSALK